jgi:hypothetical protein
MPVHSTTRLDRLPALRTPGEPPRQVRPPSGGVRMPPPGVSEDPNIRQTAKARVYLRPVPDPDGAPGYAMTHAYVRRYWVPAIGPGAVADLLRLAAAAQSGRSLRRPVHLPSLLREGLISHADGTLFVPQTVPPVPSRLLKNLPAALRASHGGHGNQISTT